MVAQNQLKNLQDNNYKMTGEQGLELHLTLYGIFRSFVDLCFCLSPHCKNVHRNCLELN